MPPTRINLLHVVLSFRAGGRRNAIQSLARGTRNSLERCDLCCLDELGCDPGEISGSFDSVFVLSRSSAGRIGVARQLREICRERDVSLIHTHDAASQFSSALVRLTRPRTKLMMTFHRSLGFESARRRDRLRNAFASSLSGAIVTASVERRDHFQTENAVARSKLHVIPLGIDTATYGRDPKRRAEIRSRLNIPPDTVVVGAVGHFGPEKGIDNVIRGFAELLSRSPGLNAVLIILGDGNPHRRALIEQLAATLPAGKVILAGYQRDIRDWYSAFDVFVHAPRLEAFGLAVIEAMSAGLPVVATRVGGVPELVRHGQTGFLCQSESPTALADSLALVISNRDLREEFGARAAEIANTEYCESLMADRYLALYRRLVFGQETAAGRIMNGLNSNAVVNGGFVTPQGTIR